MGCECAQQFLSHSKTSHIFIDKDTDSHTDTDTHKHRHRYTDTQIFMANHSHRHSHKHRHTTLEEVNASGSYDFEAVMLALLQFFVGFGVSFPEK